MAGYLGAAYLWVKAAHVIFVIFWMAGLFILPRYLVHHQEGLGDAAEEARWTLREGKLRRIILTPAMAVVWAIGLALAVNLGLLDGIQGLAWLHAKLFVVFLLSGYHGWAVGYSKRLAKGQATLTNRQLRMMNEVPALAVTVIVILAVVKPF
ncbi:CopD family protein [Sphingomonas radiodurans]|uniref:CopD family protein n=1 Tax=Sphingomonas radiodurans TaxID=2890321 RepID=UPI001E291945|nr:CopD family protein [Sphingomonas radiodurans]WBH18121.1 CopD family protein [Sphingomonas radiodurans]